MCNKSVLYSKYLKHKRDEFENIIENTIKKFLINENERFDINVLFNVNIFENYTTDELCKIFENINKYNTPLTEKELLASKLYNSNNFDINDNVLKVSLQNMIKEHYDDMKIDEVLECYDYDINSKMNVYDFMVGFQNYINSKYKFVECFNDSKNSCLSLFFKIYRTLYNSLDSSVFTNENIRIFIDKINNATEILNEIYDNIFTDKLCGNNNKTFEYCNGKINSLNTNNLYLIIIGIIAYSNDKKIKKNTIISSIEKSILFHLFIFDIKDKKNKNEARKKDVLYCNNSSEKAKEILDNPQEVFKISKPDFGAVLTDLLSEGIKEKVFNSNNDRRSRKFYEKTLMYYYYKKKVPFEFLNNIFWVEHIIPFSSTWNNNIDIDRCGNIIPIIDYLNKKRSNNHINEYKKYDETNFIRNLDKIIPTEEIYNKIINHNEKKPQIISNDNYNEMCSKNELEYKKNFLSYFYS